MAVLEKFTKTPSERKRYSIDYVDWLDDTERLTSLTFSVEPPNELEIDAHAIAPDGKSVVIFANAGEDGVEYTVTITAVTDGGQTKQDQVTFEVTAL